MHGQKQIKKKHKIMYFCIF